MNSLIIKAAAVSALASLAATAQASVITPTAAGGSEVLLTLVDIANNDSYNQDLGFQVGALSARTIDLSAGSQQFITNAGGLGNVIYAVTGGGSGSGDTYLTTVSGDLTSVSIGNGTKGQWQNTLLDLIGPLNSGDATDTSVNNSYGKYENNGSPPNYISINGPLWQSSNSAINNVWAPTDTVTLWQVAFGANAFAQAARSSTGLQTSLSATQLTIGGSVVPVPAAAWLFGSALGLLGVIRRRLAIARS